MDIDYTSRPVGSYFGGKHPVSVECGKCGLPGVVIKTSRTIRQSVWGTHYTVVHGASIRRNGGESELVYGPACGAWIADRDLWRDTTR